MRRKNQTELGNIMKRLPWFVIFIFCVVACEYSFAQTQYATKKNRSPDTSFTDHFEWITSRQFDLHEINFVGGYSFHSTKGFWGKIPDATLSIFALRYNRKLFIYKNKHILEYVGEVNLAANYELVATSESQPGSYSGFGAAPLGFQLNLNHDKVVQPFFKSSAGFMLFKKRFPDKRGTMFNFTLELGGGLEFVIAENFSFTLGYKYHHMSNGQFGQINPGIDSNIFYSGMTIF